MYFSTSVALAALAASAQAFSWPDLNRRTDNATGDAAAAVAGAGAAANPTAQGACPAVWQTISKELSLMFVANDQCTDAARAAIRAVFHDCFPDGGCDGSLATAEELARTDNVPMAPTVLALKALAETNQVGVADMLMFAGSHAVVSCPGGPTTKTMVGRKDSTTPAPDGQLPAANVDGTDALNHFMAKGFSATDLGALIGAHSTGKEFTTDPTKAGTALDSTPGIWDILYYVQTLAKKAPFTLQSDINLSNQAQVGPVMKQFSTNKPAWDGAFATAMAKMELLGQSATIDCTSALPAPSAKRSINNVSYARSIINSLRLSRK